MRKILTLAFFLLAVAPFSKAQEISLGAQVGGFGSPRASSIGYGGFFAVNPYGWAAFQVDGAVGQIKGRSHYYVSPGVILYPVVFEEFSIGFIGGAGFYGLPDVSTRFGLNGGVVGEFSVFEAFAVGMQTRYHGVLDGDDLWSVFITAAYKFEVNGGW